MTAADHENHEPAPNPHLQAAVIEEQALLDQAVLQAQAQHGINRAVQLNAELRAFRAEQATPPD